MTENVNQIAETDTPYYCLKRQFQSHCAITLSIKNRNYTNNSLMYTYASQVTSHAIFHAKNARELRVRVATVSFSLIRTYFA